MRHSRFNAIVLITDMRQGETSQSIDSYWVIRWSPPLGDVVELDPAAIRDKVRPLDRRPRVSMAGASDRTG